MTTAAAIAAIAAAVGPLVGRRDEIEYVGRLLEQERLVTVTGAGGSGKTRLALELVARAVGDTVFVSLGSVQDPSLVAAAIAQELGLGGTGAEEALVEELASRRVLLCLDNFEHVVEVAPLVARLLAAAPHLRFLVTSRTALGLSGEQEFPLAPFEEAEAVEFFTLRARRFRPAFEPDEAVPEICRRLDGLPLALDLAAARVKLLSPAQILERLQQRLPLLTAGRRDVPERHRTLRAAIDWSYQLLSAEERRLFACLSIFPGGWTLDAAEAVDEQGADTLERVASLIDKSLVQRQEGAGEPRFRMLETLREYGQEQLGEIGSEQAVRVRQAGYYVGLAELRDLVQAEVLPNVGSSMSVIGDDARARAALEEVIPLAEGSGAWASLFVARINLGNVPLRQDPAWAAEVFRAALADAASVPDTQVLHAREGLAMAGLLTGNLEAARREFAAYIGTAREAGRKAQVEAAVAGLMGIASASGDAEGAARLAGARRALSPALRVPLYLQPFEEAARAALGEGEWLRLEGEGSRLPLDEVIRPVLAGGRADAVACRAFLFTDIVSSTQLLQLIGDQAWGELVSWHDRTLRALFAAHGGEEVDHAGDGFFVAGDGFFVAFAGAGDAVACAVAIQPSLAEHRSTHGSRPR